MTKPPYDAERAPITLIMMSGMMNDVRDLRPFSAFVFARSAASVFLMRLSFFSWFATAVDPRNWMTVFHSRSVGVKP